MNFQNPPYEKSVFINCSYDADFEELFHSIVFTVIAFGFFPRSARESEGQGDTRISRITKALAASKYSLHDLSRCTGQGASNLARFNMPLELGIALALRSERSGMIRSHNFAVMVPSGYEYQQFVSDMAGFDLYRHESTVLSVVREVYSWLQQQPDAIQPAPSARDVLSAFKPFKLEVENRRDEALGKINWYDILTAGSSMVPGV